MEESKAAPPAYSQSQSATYTLHPVPVSSDPTPIISSSTSRNPSAYVPPFSAPDPPTTNAGKSNKKWKIAVAVIVVMIIIAVATGVAIMKSKSAAAADDSSKQTRIYIQSANTKQDWMDAMAAEFNAEKKMVGSSGLPAFVVVKNQGSNYSVDQWGAKDSAHVWSPANMLWVQQVDADRTALNQPKLFSATVSPPSYDPQCKAVASTPLGIAMWRQMAVALGWPDRNIGWRDIIQLAGNETGWATVGKPWGKFRFGHGHPGQSNSGRLTILATLYATSSDQIPKNKIITADVVNSNVTLTALRSLSHSVAHMGTIDTDLLDKMTAHGINYLHGVSTYESNVVKYNAERKSSLADQLVFIYPSDGTFWSEHPYCILNGGATKASSDTTGLEISSLFLTRLLTIDAQTKLIKTGLRPALDSEASRQINLSTTPNSPFAPNNPYGVLADKNTENIPILPYPSAAIMSALVRNWQTVKKPSTTCLIIDTSGSMNDGNKIGKARSAAQRYVSNMLDQDYLYIIQFSSQYTVLNPPAGQTHQISSSRASYISQIGDMFASGSTLLYDSIAEGNKLMTGLQRTNSASGVDMNYGIVVMTDGQDSGSAVFNKQSLLDSLPDGKESDQVHVFTIGWGETDDSFLRDVAARTNGKFFKGDGANIEEVYFQVSLEY